MYIVRLRINAFRNTCETSLDFATLYRMGRSLVKCGKRNHCRVSFVITDALTGKTVVRLYSLESTTKTGWVAAQSGIGKYHTHIEF